MYMDFASACPRMMGQFGASHPEALGEVLTSIQQAAVIITTRSLGVAPQG